MKIIKLSKTKKFILLGVTLVVLVPSIVIPVVLTNQNKKKKVKDKEIVLKVIKIVEEKSNSERQIKLSSDSKGKIIADNQEKIIKKIKKLIGEVNLKGVKVEISMQQDQEISNNFEKIVVKISKGNYCQTINNDKTISVKRSKTILELSLIELNRIKNSLKDLKTKVVDVYTSRAVNQKITTNKLEILKTIQKISGYSNIDLGDALVKVKDSEDVLPKNNQPPVAITLVVSKPGFSIEVSGFSAKQMSPSQIANVDLNYVKTNLESLDSKVVQVNTTSAIDHKIINNKVEILKEIQKLNGYSTIYFKGVSVKVKDSEDVLPPNNQEPIPITLILAKGGKKVEVSGFKAKSLSSQQIFENTQAVNLVKSNLESLTPETVDVYTGGAIDQKITTNKLEILKSIKKISGFDAINFNGATLEVKNSEELLPNNDQSPIAITLVVSKPGVSTEVVGFSVRQMSASQTASIDLNLVKKDLESLSVKMVEVDSSESDDQKITTNKVKILEEIAKLEGYSNINFRNVNVDIKNSDTLLPTNDRDPIPITLILSKTNTLPNNIEIEGFSTRQMSNLQIKNSKINKIKDKITNKNILIAPNVSTQNQNEIQNAIKNQLQKENPSLSNDDLSKIKTNLSTLTLGTRTEVILIINIDFTSLSLNIYVEKANLLKGSNIVSGEGGVVFQDKFKNLWAMGNYKKLQVLKANQNKDGYVTKGWTNDNSQNGEILLKNSNIIRNFNGKIFQDEFKNLWAMGGPGNLQVLRANSTGNGYDEKTGWTSAKDSGLTKGSNIIDGTSGTIFQDEFKNLWAMSRGTPLQVLRVNEDGSGYDEKTGWTSAKDSGLTNGSNITIDYYGTIFQDEFKNLWAMSRGKPLQVLRANEDGNGYDEKTGWISAKNSGLTNGSNIIRGGKGTIFQDKFKNLWAMGWGTPLQVLRVNEDGSGYDEKTGWTSFKNRGLTNGSNITNGKSGTIFQDEFKNLWAMGRWTPLQVLRVNEDGSGYDEKTGWTNARDSGLTNGSNITDGGGMGIIFQDEFKNLWAMGWGTSLQVLKVNQDGNGYDEKTGWTSAKNSGLTNGSNIGNGYEGVIYQDEFKNLWAMSDGKLISIGKIIHTKLQVLKVNLNGDGYVDLWQKPID